MDDEEIKPVDYDEARKDEVRFKIDRDGTVMVLSLLFYWLKKFNNRLSQIKIWCSMLING